MYKTKSALTNPLSILLIKSFCMVKRIVCSLLMTCHQVGYCSKLFWIFYCKGCQFECQSFIHNDKKVFADVFGRVLSWRGFQRKERLEIDNDVAMVWRPIFFSISYIHSGKDINIGKMHYLKMGGAQTTMWQTYIWCKLYHHILFCFPPFFS